MKIIYAQKSTGIDEDGSFQNPKYFDRPDTGATSVVIYGDYPEIKAAYGALNVEVEVRKAPQPKPQPITVGVQIGITPEFQAVLDEAKDECEKVVAQNSNLTGQLKQAIEDLQTERVAHLVFMNDAEAMQARIDELKQAAAIGDVATDLTPKDSQADIDGKPTENDYANWTVPQIKDFLASKEIGFKPSASKTELLALIPKV